MSSYNQELEDKQVDPHPSLQEVLKAHSIDPIKLSVRFKPMAGALDPAAREQVGLTDGRHCADWTVPSLRALFRGDRQAPSMFDSPPPPYLPLFEFVERHVIAFSDASGDKTDSEFEDVYRQLRRRPDGKPTSQLHFCLWQVAAGLAGCWPISANEFETIFGRLTRSASAFRMGPVSRNYVTVLRKSL